MSRYKYLPIEYQEYLSKYINTLRTGELLVDLNEHDIYVTEEGYNLPIPITKELRETIIEFLETDLDGINLRKKDIPNNVNNLYRIKQQIEENQYLATDKLHIMDGQIPNIENRKKFINKITDKNINQLGDIQLDLDSIKGLNNEDRIKNVVDEFNRLNDSSESVLYDSNSTNRNTTLLGLWNELSSLMSTAHSKLDSLGSFSGSAELRSSYTENRLVYDIVYSRRLYNWSNWWTIRSEADYLKYSRQLETNFGRWLRNEAYFDIRYNDMLSNTSRGSGLFYKNFPSKYNQDRGNYYGSKYNAWDLFEGLPVIGYQDKPAGYNYAYSFSPTNRAYPGYREPGKYATSANFTHRINGANMSGSSQFGGGTARWRVPYRQSTTDLRTNDSLLNIISTVNSDGLQRKPRSTKTNARAKAFSNQVPTLPTITRGTRYTSVNGILNADGLVMRLGMRKRINVTRVKYVKYKFNNNTGWS